MKKSILIAGVMIMAVVFAAMPSARADECKSLTQIATSIFSKFAEECKKEGEADTKKCTLSAKFRAIVERLNAFANNSWATLGPRKIEFGTTQTGTLIIPGDRTFLSSTPLDKNSATITITKKDGRGGAVVTICKVNDKGVYTKLKEFRFDTGDPKSPVTRTETVSGVQNHILQVRLDGQGGGPGSRLAFDFKVTK
ncbi:MAG TPA: hypothetical protein VNO14_06980 [Blastocatellia bacterium]|nr:hypothetical protein [Blastocatellia bacterium]